MVGIIKARRTRIEANYAKFIGTKYCIGCANGLDALNWILRACIEMGEMQPGVVTKDVPSNKVWIGNPARFMKII